MSAHLAWQQIALLGVYSAGMVAGQLLFKLAAPKMAAASGIGDKLAALATSGTFLGALALYGVLTVLWVWILTFTPLSRAYPFVALAFVLTPLLGAALFGEPLTWRLVLGLGAILVGLWLVTG